MHPQRIGGAQSELSLIGGHSVNKNPCVECPLADGNGKAPDLYCAKTIGSPKRPYLIVTDSPVSSDGGDVVLDRPDYRRIKKELKGFQLADFTVHSYVKCAFSQDAHSSPERKLITNHCRGHLCQVIQRQKPKLIIPLGLNATNQVLHKPCKMTSVRGRPLWSDEHNTYVFPLLSPVNIVVYPQHRPAYDSDINALRKFISEGCVLNTQDHSNGKYKIIDDLQFLIDQEPPLLSFDIEATGLRHAENGSKILSMQFCIKPGEAYMLVWEHKESPCNNRQKRKLLHQLRALLCNKKTAIVGHNLKFDAVWILHHFGIRIRIGHDTQMLAVLLDENQQSKSLDALTKRYVPDMSGYADDFNLTYNKSKMDLVPLDDLLMYGCGDVDAVMRLYEVLKPQVWRDTRLWANYRRVAIPSLNAFVPIEADGQLIDESKLDDFEKELEERTSDLRHNLLAQVERTIKRKHKDSGLEFTRQDFLIDILFKHPDGLKLKPLVFTDATANLAPELRRPSTSTKQHLPYFFHNKFVADLANYIKLKRLLDSNVKSFKKKYVRDGYIYPKYSLTTTVTGRAASSDPNAQNYPKRGEEAKAYRSIFRAPEGHYLLEADLSQAELRIVSDMANESTMIDIYRKNGDIHKETAKVVMGVTEAQYNKMSKEEQSFARFQAKAVNFGFLYGMGWRTFIRYAKTDYNVDFSEEEAKRIREDFFRKYAGLAPWHDRVRCHVRNVKEVRSYSGRIRHLEMIDSTEGHVVQKTERLAINSPVQNFASDLGLMAMARIDKDIPRRYMQIIGFVHDALYAYVPYEYIEWGAKTMKHYMETNPLDEWFRIRLKVPVVADVGFGMHAGDMYEMPNLAFNQRYDFSVHDLDFTVPVQKSPKKINICNL